jgi:hypothetical protein
MRKQALAATISVFFLACGVLSGNAQQSPGSPMLQPDQQQMHQPDTDHECGVTGGEMMGGGMMGRRGMMGHGMMGMMGGQGMMGPLAMRIIFALMDSDGDGTISLQEFQAAHEKIFKAMDTDKDGTVSFEEMQAFMHGSKRAAPQH